MTRFIVLMLVASKLSAEVSVGQFEEFGILRANITHYCANSKWLICADIKSERERSEIIGFNKSGNLFVLTGNLPQETKDFLSIEKFKNPSVMFSTKEGYLYQWGMVDGVPPFENFLRAVDYEKFIKKFELYPLLKESKEGPVSFQHLDSDPGFLERAFSQDRPESIFELKSPTAKPTVIGVDLSEVLGKGYYYVNSVVESLCASAAGLRQGDIITRLSVNGNEVDIGKIADIQYHEGNYVLTFRVARKLGDKNSLFLNVNVFPPSSLELLLGR